MTHQKQLVLHNDDKHDVNFVRACLIRYCKHDFTQAEQCVIITHVVGKCSVKQGDIMDLLEIQKSLEENGLKTELISMN